MALSTQQIAGLNALNQKIASGYKPTATDTANLDYAKKQGYTYNPIPQGATKITGPSGLQGLTESQIFRQGQDIYKLPQLSSVDTTVDPSVKNPAIPEPEVVDNIPSLMAGLETTNKGTEAILKAQQQQLASQPKANALQTRLEQAMGEQKTAQRDLQVKTQDQFKLQENFDKVSALMPQIARLEADFNAAEIAAEGRVGSASSIYGRQSLLRRQKAVELAGLSAVAQAYQGNVDLARQISQDAVNAQYQDITNYNNNLKTQLDAVYDDLTREEKVKADQLTTIIDERKRMVEEEKNTQTAIQNIGIEIARAGGDADIVSKIMNAKTPEKAIELAIKSGRFKLQANWTNVGQTSTGEDLFYDDTSGSFKTADQLTQNNLGEQIGTIKGLPSYDTRSANPGMVRSDRNNNPGNIKVSDYTKEFAGVVGVESNTAEDGGNFLIFESPQAGLDAIGRLLLEGNAYQNVNAETAIKKYNGGGVYGARDVGLDPNKDFQSQIQDQTKRREVARAIAMAEGWSGGVIKDTSTAKTIADAILATQPNQEDTAADLVAKEKAQLALDLKSSKGLDGAVGIGYGIVRTAAPWNLGAKADFIAGVEQLTSGLSLEELIAAKGRGATFGALSDSELQILSSAATKIGTWRIKNNNGKVIGYKASEKSFKDELDNINKILLRGVKVNNGIQSSQDPLGLGVSAIANSTNPLGI